VSSQEICGLVATGSNVVLVRDGLCKHLCYPVFEYNLLAAFES